MNSNTPIETDRIYTPAFVVPFGKCIHEAHNAGSHLPKGDDVRIVDDFRAVMEKYSVGTPVRTYYDTMLANARMIARGIHSKSSRRDALLKELEDRRAEMEKKTDQNDKFWERIMAAKELIIVGGLFFAFFSFVGSVPGIARLLHGGSEGYAALATTLGSVLGWSTIRTRFNDKRSEKAARYYHWMSNRIYRMHRLSIRREYFHALNSLNIAWKHMPGENPQDAEISKLVIETLTREGEEYDQLNGDGFEKLSLKEILQVFWLSRKRGIKEGASITAEVSKKT